MQHAMRRAIQRQHQHAAAARHAATWHVLRVHALRRRTGGTAQQVAATRFQRLLDGLAPSKLPAITAGMILIPERKVTEGLLIRSTSQVWFELLEEVGKDWRRAHEVPPRAWEELVAGAFKNAGYDEVILTPRSGDLGRDVIAIKRGVGCTKTIVSVKAYKDGRVVKHNEVRDLLGVLSGEADASKAMLTTTTDFAPLVHTDPLISRFMPTRLELINGKELAAWLKTIRSPLRWH